jgi:putative nucleotidyltransferase with HDIG domain
VSIAEPEIVLVPSQPTPTHTADSAELIVYLLKQALRAPAVADAVKPMLSAVLQRTAAVGAAYFQARGSSFMARAAEGVMPQGPAMNMILLHGLPNATPLLQVLKDRDTAIFIDDTATNWTATGFPELQVRSLAAAPVHTQSGELLGAFLMHCFHAHSWTANEQQLFLAVSHIMAQMTARLVAEEQVRQAHEDTLRALGLALEYRDDETKGHTDRVTQLAMELGRALNLPEAKFTALRWGAYLHDIGKIAISDTILHKPGRLSDEEWRTMRQHTQIGETFALELSFLPTAARALIRSHHERWDGRGYPDGLAGEEIPLVARIFALCDVFDALTSVRPYKQAWPVADALREIEACAGTQFDPALVKLFVELVRASAMEQTVS